MHIQPIIFFIPFDKKAIILIASLAGLLVIALTTTILLDSKSEPIAFENDYSETSSAGTSYDEDAGFDSYRRALLDVLAYGRA